jgi:hypothetical protein
VYWCAARSKRKCRRHSYYGFGVVGIVGGYQTNRWHLRHQNEFDIGTFANRVQVRRKNERKKTGKKTSADCFLISFFRTSKTCLEHLGQFFTPDSGEGGLENMVLAANKRYDQEYW